MKLRISYSAEFESHTLTLSAKPYPWVRRCLIDDLGFTWIRVSRFWSRPTNGAGTRKTASELILAIEGARP